MLILAAHAFYMIAFTVGSAWDLMTTEVPDSISIASILVGVALHAALFFQTGNSQPLIWSMAAGSVFGIYGWAMYFTGSWGGADAFALTALGFSAAVSLSGPSFVHLFDLFVNVMLAGFLYAVSFSIYKAFQTEGFVSAFGEKLRKSKNRMIVELAGSIFLSIILSRLIGISLFFYLGSLVGMIFLYRFLKVIEEKAMTKKMNVSEVEVGEVIVEGGKDSKIKGATEEDLEELSGEVKVKEGVMFVPVFPVALFLTDMQLFGIEILVNLVSL